MTIIIQDKKKYSKGNFSLHTASHDVEHIGCVLNDKRGHWELPEELPESDITLHDNVLISMFPTLNSCGSIVHENGYENMEDNADLRFGIDCCGVCAKKYNERFRCKKCHRVVYCSAAHQAADRGFHSTVCEALQVVENDSVEVDIESKLNSFVTRLYPSPLPGCTTALLDLSLEEIFQRFLFNSDTCTEWKCLSFLHGTSLGRLFMEHASFPLTLWSHWERFPLSQNIIVHIIGAARSECQFPALWTLMLPHGDRKEIKELIFFGPHVPKSLHGSSAHSSLKFYRERYHDVISRGNLRSPNIVLAPALGTTSNRYKWNETFRCMKDFLDPGTLIISTCYSYEEMDRESHYMMEALRLKMLCPPYLNPFASTRIQQNTHLANDVFRSNYVVCIFQKI